MSKISSVILFSLIVISGVIGSFNVVVAEAKIKTITTDKAALPVNHYSQALVYNNVVYAAGVVGNFPDRPKYVGTIEEQTEQALNNLREVLLAANSDLDHVLMVTIYLTDPTSASKVSAIYARIFGNHKPARAMVTVANLAGGFKIEIVATAAVK